MYSWYLAAGLVALPGSKNSFSSAVVITAYRGFAHSRDLLTDLRGRGVLDVRISLQVARPNDEQQRSFGSATGTPG